jgi:hypothetical protein
VRQDARLGGSLDEMRLPRPNFGAVQRDDLNITLVGAGHSERLPRQHERVMPVISRRDDRCAGDTDVLLDGDHQRAALSLGAGSIPKHGHHAPAEAQKNHDGNEEGGAAPGCHQGHAGHDTDDDQDQRRYCDCRWKGAVTLRLGTRHNAIMPTRTALRLYPS